MAGTTFKLDPEPTFTAPVEIPIPGKAPEKVVFTFKHLGRKEVKKLYDSKPDDSELLHRILAGWELDDEFNRENIDRLIDGFSGSPHAISNAYLKQLREGNQGN